MFVSVVVPAYNNEDTIGAVLDALLKQSYDSEKMEIIVVDDKSTDATSEIIQNYPVTKIFNEKNLGLAESMNKAIILSKHDIVVTLHADTIPLTQTWLKTLIAPLVDPNVAATCSLQIPPNIQQRTMTLWEKMVYGIQKPHNALNDKADAHKKNILEEIGLFDARTFRTAGEDEDLALRLRLHKKSVLGTKAKVMHNHYYKVRSKRGVLSKILQKEFTFGKAGGALRRKYPKYKPGSYIFPNPKPFTNDGLFRVIICLGALMPFIQLMFIPLVIIASTNGICNMLKINKKLTLIYPFFNMLRYMSYTFGYINGLIIGKQK